MTKGNGAKEFLLSEKEAVLVYVGMVMYLEDLKKYEFGARLAGDLEGELFWGEWVKVVEDLDDRLFGFFRKDGENV